jgi:hypothetical protein
MANALRHYLQLSISPNCSRNIILDSLIRIRVQSMRVLLKIVFSRPYWSPVSKSFPCPTSDLSLWILAITLSSSTTISSSVLLNRVPLDRTYRGIHGVLNILGFYIIVFLQTGCGNFFFLALPMANSTFYQICSRSASHLPDTGNDRSIRFCKANASILTWS